MALPLGARAHRVYQLVRETANRWPYPCEERHDWILTTRLSVDVWAEMERPTDLGCVAEAPRV